MYLTLIKTKDLSILDIDLGQLEYFIYNIYLKNIIRLDTEYWDHFYFRNKKFDLNICYCLENKSYLVSLYLIEPEISYDKYLTFEITLPKKLRGYSNRHSFEYQIL